MAGAERDDNNAPGLGCPAARPVELRQDGLPGVSFVTALSAWLCRPPDRYRLKQRRARSASSRPASKGSHRSWPNANLRGRGSFVGATLCVQGVDGLTCRGLHFLSPRSPRAMTGKTSAPCLEGQSLSPTEAQCNPLTTAGSSGVPRDALISFGDAFWRNRDQALRLVGLLGGPVLGCDLRAGRGAGHSSSLQALSV
jgi:hypothetical protein